MPALIVLQVISSARLLEEPLDVAVGVGLDQAVGARVLDRRQDDRRLGLALAVQPEHRREVDVGQHVAVEDDDRLGQRIARVADRAAGAERHRLDDVADAQPGFAVAENLLDAPRLIVEAENDLVDLRHLLQEIDLVVQERPVEDRHDRLGRVDGHRGCHRIHAEWVHEPGASRSSLSARSPSSRTSAGPDTAHPEWAGRCRRPRRAAAGQPAPRESRGRRSARGGVRRPGRSGDGAAHRRAHGCTRAG